MITVHFSYSIPKETFHNQTQVLTYGTALIPSPAPSDLRVDVDNTNGITITYSLEFANQNLAAAAILKTLKSEIPT